MWVIALLFGFGAGGLCEYFRRERELRRQHTKEGTPSASHNSESTQLKCVSCGSMVPSNTVQKHTGLCSLCNPPF
jgi:ribosomal protein L37E